MVYDGPVLDYILLNQKGAQRSIILSPNALAETEIFYPQISLPNYNIEWEIRHESWVDYEESIILPNIKFEVTGKKTTFIAPDKEGPYRLFLYLTNDSDYYATANIPFYVLNPSNGN